MMKVELIEQMGSDLTVANAARVSFEKESDWDYSEYCETCNDYHEPTLKNADAKLIAYLAKHNHWTPFGHCFVSFRIKAPIFVARQLGKHQVGLVWNEVSRRYVSSEPEFYMPTVWRMKADNVKQGSSDVAVDTIRWEAADDLPSDVYEDALTMCEAAYEALLAGGVCPEQARMVLPQSMMTEWIWSGSLFAIAKMCKLRLDSHTQYETRLVALKIAQKMVDLYPVSWKALMDHG